MENEPLFYDSTKEETAFGGFENYGSYLSETEQQIIPSAKNMLETAPDYALPESIAFDDGFKETQEYRVISRTAGLLRKQREQARLDIEQLERQKQLAQLGSDEQIEHLTQRFLQSHHIIVPLRQMIANAPSIDFSVFESLPDNDGNPAKSSANGNNKARHKVWTPEEQSKLERLLQEYPEEAVQTHRWEKISRALGTKTPKQVGSRVTKFFFRMAKAGLPVPGRMPNLDVAPKKNKKRKAVNHAKMTNPSFQTQHVRHFRPPSVLMEESDSEDEVDEEMAQFKALKDTPEYRELLRLRKLQKKKDSNEVWISGPSSSEVIHYGFVCSKCGADPIRGIRYKCTVCKEVLVNLCEDCATTNYTTPAHLASHRFKSIKIAENPNFTDADYANAQSQTYQGEFSYLDPSYMPV